MAKVQVILNSVVLDEYPVVQEKTTVGRRSSNDIKLESVAVSGLHAVFERVGQKVFVTDNKSTNGTLVNGKKIHRHVLHDGDEVSIAKYILKFWLSEPHGPAVSPKTVAIGWDEIEQQERGEESKMAESLGAEIRESGQARLRVQSGANAGKAMALNKEMTTMGKPGVQVAVIMSRPSGFFLTQVEGRALRINGTLVNAWPYKLQLGDQIEFMGTRLVFEN